MKQGRQWSAVKPSVVLAGIGLSLLLPLSSCAGGNFSRELERSLAADPRLQENPGVLGNATPTPAPAIVNLPANFPSEIPLYPGATLQAVEGTAVSATSSPAPDTTTRWQTADSPEQVRQWYAQRLQAEGWQVQPGAAAIAPLVAQRDGLQVSVAVASDAPAPTAFTLSYRRSDAAATLPSDIPTPSSAVLSPPATNPELARVPQPGDPDFIGPVPPPNFGAGAVSPATPAATASPTVGAIASPIPSPAAVSQAPPQLQPYLTDLLALGSLKSAENQPASFDPNQPISRREFARWLVDTNNRIHSNRPANQIRLATAGSQPIFQDVPASDPDFGVIQGLAEAGLIPSPLSGDASAVTFRPDDALTRETLLLWKTPLDTRRTLPNATVDLVQQTWGFQDAPQINPRALRAIAADYQNGEQSNIRRAFGFTTLFQPNRPVTKAEAAAALWFFGIQGDGLSAKDVLQAPPA